jgi:DNA repair protein RadC
MLTACTHFSPSEYKTVRRAMNILTRTLRETPEFCATSPETSIDYIRLQFYSRHEREHFLVLFLDNQNKLITSEFLFSGTINHVEVHPRVIAQQALKYNAQALILAHNHPSDSLSPSPADIRITEQIRQIMTLLDIRILDHFIVPATGTDYYSFALHGQL